MRTGRRNNQGLSIIELIVVIAILGILAGGLLSTTGILTDARNKKCIQSIATAIGGTKTDTMAKARGDDPAGEVFLEIWDGGNKGILLKETVGTVETEKKVGDEGLKVTYTGPSGTGEAILPGESNKLKIVFNRSSGAVETSDFSTITAGKFKVKVEPHTGKCKME